jgi:DNA invertase Pin-like site-specific DNA recombinase
MEGKTMMVATKRGGKRIGYVRVSSIDQNEARQVEALADLHIDKVFTDKASGKDTKRPQLQAALDYMRDGDVMVVPSMDRLARNMRDLQNLVADLNSRNIAVEFISRNIAVEFIKEGLSFSGDDSPMSKLMLSILGGVAEFERAIKERQREGIAVAKGKGVYRGRKSALTGDQVNTIRQRAAAGERKAMLAREYKISRETLYQALRPGYAAIR